MPNERRAIFLARDGTIIVDVGYPRHPDQVRLLPGAANALQTLQKKGFLIIVVSNQSGIGRGYVTPQETASVHQSLFLCFRMHMLLLMKPVIARMRLKKNAVAENLLQQCFLMWQ